MKRFVFFLAAKGELEGAYFSSWNLERLRCLETFPRQRVAFMNDGKILKMTQKKQKI